MITPIVKIIQRPPPARDINKQLDFGLAVGLTRTATQGVDAVIGATKGTFTTRGTWFEKQNKYGVRVKAATPKNPVAEVRSQADWFVKQKEGGNIPAPKDVRTFHYTYKGKRYIAIPTSNVRPKGSTKVLTRQFWASTIRKKKGTFVIKTKKGGLLVMNRFAPGPNGVEALFNLIPEETIKPKDTFVKPVQDLAQKTLNQNIAEGIEFALRTAK